jgi:HEAT repeat protein
VSTIDGEARRIMESSLQDPRDDVRAFAVAAIAAADGSGDSIRPLMDDPSPVVRSAVFDALCSVDPGMIADHAATAMNDPEPSVRAQTLRSLRSAGEDEAVDVAMPSLNDSDPVVRAVAAATVGGTSGARVLEDLVRSGDRPSVVAALGEAANFPGELDLDLSSLRADPDSVIRSLAYGIRTGKDRVDDLVIGLDDLSLQVRTSAARALGRSPEGRRRLLGVLSTGSVIATEAALMSIGPEAKSDPMFLEWAESEARRAALLDSYRQRLQGESGDTTNLLIHTLKVRTDRLERWVLQAMSDRRTESAMGVVRKGISSSDMETRSQAIEALESIGDRSVTRVLLPLLDSDPVKGSASAEDALIRLSDDFDPWLQRLARRALGERGHDHGPGVAGFEAVERRETLDMMERVMALQRVALFSGLDPEDLELIAGVTTEIYHEPGTRIYRQGERGEEMLVIVEGEAIVSMTVPGAAPREIHRYHAPDHVGELALLRGGTRSADVDAGADGLLGVVVGKQDLISILEERPSVAMKLLGTLAERLIEQS